MKEERNKTLLHQMKLSIKFLIQLHWRPIRSYSSDDPQQKTDSSTAEVNWTSGNCELQ